jgi:hypothetical protein
MNLSQCINLRWRSDAQGHFLPRGFVAVVAAVPLITDTKAINRRDRFGPTTASHTAINSEKFSGQFCYAARSTRMSISLRSVLKSIGLVSSASAPFSSALRLVSASP